MAEVIADLLARYKLYVGQWKERGGSVRVMALPCCGNELEVPVPMPGERQWDSLMACTHCGQTVMKVAQHDKAVAHLLHDPAHN